MDSKDLSTLTNEELLAEAEKIKPSPKIDAFFIGFLIGIILFGVVVSASFLAFLIPLFIIYLFLRKSKGYSALQNEMKKRGLK